MEHWRSTMGNHLIPIFTDPTRWNELVINKNREGVIPQKDEVEGAPYQLRKVQLSK